MLNAEQQKLCVFTITLAESRAGGAAAGGGGGRGRGGGPAVRRVGAGGVRAGDHRRGGAHGGVLHQPARAAGVLLPVRAQPGVQPLHQQPRRPRRAHRLRHRHPALLEAPGRRVPARSASLARASASRSVWVSLVRVVVWRVD